MSYISNAPKIRVRRWLAVAAVAASLAAPATALGVQQPDLPRGIMGATNDDGGRGDALQGAGLAIRRRTQAPAQPAV